MSLMRTLAKVAIGVAVAKGAKAVMQNNKSGAGGGGLGGLLGGLTGGGNNRSTEVQIHGLAAVSKTCLAGCLAAPRGRTKAAWADCWTGSAALPAAVRQPDWVDLAVCLAVWQALRARAG